MPRTSKKKTRSKTNGQNGDRTVATNGNLIPPGTTGRFLVLFREDGDEAERALREAAGLRVARAADFDDGAVEAASLSEAEAILFDDLGVAVVNTPPEQVRNLAAAVADEDNPILAVEPERIVYALSAVAPAPALTVEREEIGELFTPTAPVMHVRMPAAAPVELPLEFLRGYREGVDHLIERLLSVAGVSEQAVAEAVAAFVETDFTWGLQATKVTASRFSGQGIRVAVLDTGFDMGHPDFVGRRIESRSFITGQTVQDGHGHGTHCIGTACGPRRPAQLPRYGVAFNSEIFVGKVLSNQGSGADGGILAGIQWAVTNRCEVVSMSLGGQVQIGEGFSFIFEQVARRALSRGTLIIAAAGNDSMRPAVINPVSHPANCPSIMAVAAINQQLFTAPFSNGGLNPNGGQIDIAGPGVAVQSSFPRPVLRRTLSGTSMATPHVAGIAALLAEANPGARARALASLLIQGARRLPLPARDIGSGLVQAP